MIDYDKAEISANGIWRFLQNAASAQECFTKKFGGKTEIEWRNMAIEDLQEVAAQLDFKLVKEEVAVANLIKLAGRTERGTLQG